MIDYPWEDEPETVEQEGCEDWRWEDSEPDCDDWCDDAAFDSIGWGDDDAY